MRACVVCGKLVGSRGYSQRPKYCRDCYGPQAVRYPCGHPRTVENTIQRTCRVCKNALNRAAYARSERAREMSRERTRRWRAS